MEEESESAHELPGTPGFRIPLAECGKPQDAPVRYASANHLLLICAPPELELCLPLVPADLEIFVLLSATANEAVHARFAQQKISLRIQQTAPAISGYLGNFRIDAPVAGNSTPAFSGPDWSTVIFDLVLEIAPFRVVTPALPAPGYFRIDCHKPDSRNRIAAISDWVGEFEKPKFFNFSEGLCAHQSSSITGCSNCLSACATAAISSEAGKIRINPHLCQGCADCVSSCPSGAIRYAYPAPARVLEVTRQAIADFVHARSRLPVVIFHTDDPSHSWMRHIPGFTDDLIAIEIEAIGSAGLEIWLATLAYGAAGVLLLDNPEPLPQTRGVQQQQLDHCRKILAGMRYSPNMVRSVSGKSELLQAAAELLPAVPRDCAGFTPVDDKRTVVRLAVNQLLKHSANPREFALLSADAPFGEIAVDAEKCTLCMACVSVCPESALTDRPDQPTLGFIEANCVQCSICEQACPEEAITLKPRYLLDSTQSRKSRILNTEQPVLCIECNKPFATRSMIRTITEKLESHPMFQGENQRRLLMCEDCRIRDTLKPDQ